MKSLALIILLLSTLSLAAKLTEEHPGTAVFKLKPEFRVSVQKSMNRTGIVRLDAKLNNLQVSEIKPYFNTTSPKSAASDISLI
ncbi:MAG: hypothetical protein PHO32_06085, partial [Candidatus Cloacimonetes bacterium]|nr:hypothetical protein [Candidatus Cloacimonadota bacterium]